MPIGTRSRFWVAMALSIAIHAVILAALVVESKRVPAYHPATYGMDGGSPVVQFVSVTVDGAAGRDGTQDGNSSLSDDGLPASLPQPVEMSELAPLEDAPTVERLLVATSSSREERPAGEFAAGILPSKPNQATAAISGMSHTAGFTGGDIDGNTAGQGRGRIEDGVGAGRPAGGGSGAFGRPAYLRNPPPPYPRVARERGWEGTTLLQVEVFENGGGGRVEILKSSGYEVLDDSAMETVRHWKFLPARSGDNPIRSLVEIPIRFRMTAD